MPDLLPLMQHWSKLVHPSGEPWPVRRTKHAAVGLGDDHLLVTGGLTDDDYHQIVLSDMWLLSVRSGRWREVSATIISNLELVQESANVVTNNYPLISYEWPLKVQ